MIHVTRLNYEDNPIRVMSEDGDVYFNARDVGLVMGLSGGSRVFKSYCPSYRNVFLREIADSRASRGATEGWRVNGECFILDEDVPRLFKASHSFSANAKYQERFKAWVDSVLKEIAKPNSPCEVKAEEATLATNAVKVSNGSLGRTMSSVEIADLTGKNHPDVLRDIRQQIFTGLYGYVFDKAKLLYPEIQGVTVVLDEITKRTKEVLLDRYHTDILISGYEIKYRAAIIKRWHELEQGVAISPKGLSADELLKLYLRGGEALGLPLKDARERAVACVRRDTGVDFSPFLN